MLQSVRGGFTKLSLAALSLCSFSDVAFAEISGDFDCDGRKDRAVVTDSGSLDVNLASGEVLNGVQVGEKDDTVFATDLDGDGCSELYASGKSGFSSVNLAQAPVTTSGQVSVFGLPCDQRLSNSDGSGGFVNNPNNGKGKLKAVLPKRYNRSLKRLRLSKRGAIIETLDFVGGNEWGDRMRFYSKKSPSAYGKNIVWVLDLKNGRRECIPIPEPTKRYD